MQGMCVFVDYYYTSFVSTTFILGGCIDTLVCKLLDIQNAIQTFYGYHVGFLLKNIHTCITILKVGQLAAPYPTLRGYRVHCLHRSHLRQPEDGLPEESLTDGVLGQNLFDSSHHVVRVEM